MKSIHRILLLALALACAPSCDRGEDAADSHAHGEAGGVSVTHWTDQTELFLEHPLLVAGQPARAAVHVTVLDGFSPLDQGETTITLKSAEGRVQQFRGGPSAPGIFGVNVTPDAPGDYAMTLKIEAPGLVAVHELGPVTVHDAGGVPPQATVGETEISFLKEQQWTLDFGTVAAEVRSLRASVVVPATIQPRAGGEALLTAPVAGRIAGPGVPVSGSAVGAGDILARIVPRPDDLGNVAELRSALVEAEQQHALAVRERARVERLVDGRALPTRRLDEANAGLKQSEARLASARQRWGRYESASGAQETAGAVFEVRATFAGVVAEVKVSGGSGVEEGQPLLRVVDAERVHVVGAVPESSAAILREVAGGELLMDNAAPLPLDAPLAVGRVVDPVNRTTEVRFALNNAMRFPVGRSVELRLFIGGEVSGAAVPETAIVDDGGRPVVFVQAGGESFARRPVRLGAREAGWVHVVDGVEAGERVVHEGAYLVRLVAMSTQIPSHGHVH